LAAAKKATTLKRYGRVGAEGGWHFLTGDEAAIQRLTGSVGFRYAWDEGRGQYAHAAGIIVLTPQGRVSRYLNGIEFSARDARLALVEASSNRIGTVTDQVLLFCYLYDPTTGKYTLAIWNALRLGGVLTVLALVGGIGTMLLRERRLGRCADEPMKTAAVTEQQHSNSPTR
jgi:protein SCO1/2